MSPSTTLKLRLTIQQNHLDSWLETQGGATHTYLVICVPKMLPWDSEAGPGLHKHQYQHRPHLRGIHMKQEQCAQISQKASRQNLWACPAIRVCSPPPRIPGSLPLATLCSPLSGEKGKAYRCPTSVNEWLWLGWAPNREPWFSSEALKPHPPGAVGAGVEGNPGA